MASATAGRECGGGDGRRLECGIDIGLRRGAGRAVAIADAARVDDSVAVDNAGTIGARGVVAETNAAIVKLDAGHLVRLDGLCGGESRHGKSENAPGAESERWRNLRQIVPKS